MNTIRRNVPGVVYHLIWRFVDQRYFIDSRRERSVYLKLLGNALARSDWRCLSYAVMSNHIHLAMIAGREPLASWTRRVNSPFASWMNQRAQRIGPVFARGARDFAIPSAREAKLLAYIHRNPVRAGLVTRASESTWTSHRAFVGRMSPPAWLHVDEALTRMGMSAREFGRWIDSEEGDSGKIATDLLSAQLRRRGALLVATPASSVVPIVVRPTGYWRPDPRTIVRIGCELSGTPLPLVCSRRHIEEVLATRRAIVFAAVEHGLSYNEIADALGVSQQAVSKIARRTLTSNEARLLEMIRERIELDESCESGMRPVRRLSFRNVTDRKLLKLGQTLGRATLKQAPRVGSLR